MNRARKTVKTVAGKNTARPGYCKPAGYWQAGTLYELPICAVLLIIAGAILSPHHHMFLILSAVGILVFLWPFIGAVADWAGCRIKRIKLKNRCVKELRKRGFSPGPVLRGNRGLGALIFDAALERIAVGDASGEIGLFDKSGLLEIVFSSGEVVKWGSPSQTWYYMEFKFPGKSLTLAFSSKRCARRLLKKAYKITGNTAPLDDRTQ